MKYSGRFLCPVANTCLPISSKTTGLDSRFINNMDCNCVFARCKIINEISFQNIKTTTSLDTRSSCSDMAPAIDTISLTITSTISRTCVGGALA